MELNNIWSFLVGFFTWPHIVEVHPCWGVHQYVTSFYSYRICHQLWILHFFFKSIGRRVFGLFPLLAIVNSTDMHVFVQVPCGHIFSFVENIYQELAGCGRQKTNAPTSYCLKDVSVQILWICDYVVSMTMLCYEVIGHRIKIAGGLTVASRSP